MEELYRKCYLKEWYPEFKNLTINSSFIELPSGVKDFVLNEDFIIPKDLLSNSDPKFGFVEFDKIVKSTIDSMKPCKAFFVKLDSSTLDDASYMVLNSEVYDTLSLIKVLKSSNKATYELKTPFGMIGSDSTNETHTIAFRNSIEMKPKGEFRLFFKKSKLFAISQRHTDISVKHDEKTRDALIGWTEKWLLQHELPVENIVVDVYLREFDQKQRDVIIVDMEPLTDSTNMLFVPSELGEDFVELHTVDRENVGIMSSSNVESRYPLELTAALSGDQEALELLREIGLKI